MSNGSASPILNSDENDQLASHQTAQNLFDSVLICCSLLILRTIWNRKNIGWSYRSWYRVHYIEGRCKNVHHEYRAADKNPWREEDYEASPAQTGVVDAGNRQKGGDDQSTVKCKVNDREDERSVSCLRFIRNYGCLTLCNVQGGPVERPLAFADWKIH